MPADSPQRLIRADGREQLERLLKSINDRPYNSYRRLRGDYTFRYFTLHVDFIQGDPFASPSQVRVEIPHRSTGWSGWMLAEPHRRTAIADYVLRRLSRAARALNSARTKGDPVHVDAPHQEVLPHSGCVVSPEGDTTLRFYVNLPADGRRIAGREAFELLAREIPKLVTEHARLEVFDTEDLTQHIHAIDDQVALRTQLKERKLVAFVANDALLPRRAGNSDAPMRREDAVLWDTPESLLVTLNAPHAGPLEGLGIREGITLICGGGFHGKSTVLSALARGIYNHPPGDGREQIVTRADAVKLRAEDGRRVCGVDISPFIDHLPDDRPTHAFTTSDASGSTSQAANLIEALELGADVLLIDEDTSATNFMVRDRRMQELIVDGREPITPLLDRIQALRDDRGVSTILVMGGNGDYLDVADTVLIMDDYSVQDATERAAEIVGAWPSRRQRLDLGPFPSVAERVPLPKGFNPSKGRKDVRVRSHDTRVIEFGAAEIDLTALDQLISPAQARTVADAMVWALKRNLIDGRRTLRQVVDALVHELETSGPIRIAQHHHGNRAWVRRHEIGAAINRLRTLVVRQRKALSVD